MELVIRKTCFAILLISLTACTSSDDPYIAYSNGDYETAREKLEPLAAEGDQVAQTYLGSMYQMGLGVKRDYQQAYMLYEKAAKDGYASAQYNIGVMLYEGLGVDEDRNQAYGWFFLAGEQDHELAKERLHLMGTQLEVIPNQVQPAIKWAKSQLN